MTWADGMNEHDQLRAAVVEVERLRAELVRMSTNWATLERFMEVLSRGLPERFDCRLCGAADADDHHPDCELVAAMALLGSAK